MAQHKAVLADDMASQHHILTGYLLVRQPTQLLALKEALEPFRSTSELLWMTTLSVLSAVGC